MPVNTLYLTFHFYCTFSYFTVYFGQHYLQSNAGFKEKGPVSSLQWGPFSGIFSGVKSLFPSRNFHFGRPNTNFSGFKKSKGKKKKSSATPACYVTVTFPLFFSFPGGPDFFGGGPENRGPCQQLLALLILKSTTATKEYLLETRVNIVQYCTKSRWQFSGHGFALWLSVSWWNNNACLIAKL